MEAENKSFLYRAAQDYDMDIYDVERIYRLYPESFYEELERFIKDRANQQ